MRKPTTTTTKMFPCACPSENLSSISPDTAFACETTNVATDLFYINRKWKLLLEKPLLENSINPKNDITWKWNLIFLFEPRSIDDDKNTTKNKKFIFLLNTWTTNRSPWLFSDIFIWISYGFIFAQFRTVVCYEKTNYFKAMSVDNEKRLCWT